MSEKRKRREEKRAAERRDAAKRERARDARIRRDEQGRAHLVVQRDAQGNVVAMGLERPLFRDAWQNEVAVAAASTAHQLLQRGHTLENAVELGKNAMAGTSKIADGVLSQAVEPRPACHAGCAHCCYQAVGVSAPEVLAILQHLRATRTPAELEALTAHVRLCDDATRGLGSAERLSPRFPCPFLGGERCTIYEVRPLACRGTNSIDASACERTLRDPDARAEFLAGSVSVPCFVEPIRAFHAVAAGLQLALSELHGLHMLPLDLTAAMRMLLDDPEGVSARWLAGEDPLAPARGADNTQNRLIRELSGRLD